VKIKHEEGEEILLFIEKGERKKIEGAYSTVGKLR
jgi:hypothetical protein